MNDALKEALEILVSNHYILSVDGKFMITNKFTRELEEADPKELFQKKTELTPHVSRELIKLSSKTKSVIPVNGQESYLSKFIIECQVPSKIKDSSGKFYWVNKYNKEAEIELVKIVTQMGYDRQILVAATKLYYKAGGYVEAISNFILRGSWLTHYQEMEKQLKAGTVNKHIKQNLETQTAGVRTYDDR